MTAGTQNYALNGLDIALETTHGIGVAVLDGGGYTGPGSICGSTIKNCKVAVLYGGSTGNLSGSGIDMITGNTYAVSLGGGTDFTNVRFVNCPGVNGAGWLGGSTPTLPSTGNELQNTTGFDAWVVVSGGSVTAIQQAQKAGGSYDSIGASTFLFPAGSAVKLTYTGSPTWRWFGL